MPDSLTHSSDRIMLLYPIEACPQVPGLLQKEMMIHHFVLGGGRRPGRPGRPGRRPGRPAVRFDYDYDFEDIKPQRKKQKVRCFHDIIYIKYRVFTWGFC